MGSPITSGSTAINFSSGAPVAMTVYLSEELSREFQVTAAILVGLDILPDPAVVSITRTMQFTALAQYSNGTSIDVTGTTSWSSSDILIAIITPQGVATGVSIGSVIITGAYGTFSTNIALNVNPLLTGIDITLGGSPVTSEILVLGETLAFQAIANYIGIASVDVTASANWTIASGTSVTVSSGAVNAISTGTSVVQAEYSGVTGSVIINAVPRTTYYVAEPVNGGDDSGFGSLTDPLATISEAMTRAIAGDEIRVANGTYTDHVTLKDRVSIHGSWDIINDVQGAAWNSTLNGDTLSADGAAFVATTAISNNTVIDGLIIFGGLIANTDCHTVFLQNNANPTFSFCYIRGAGDAAASSHGIYIDSSSPIIVNCGLTGNDGTNESCAVTLIDSNAIIERSNIGGGLCPLISIGISVNNISLPVSSPVIRNNVITGGFGDTTIAINLMGAGNTKIYNNTIDCGKNASTAITGIRISDHTPDIINNILFSTGNPTTLIGINEVTATGCTPTAFRYNWVYLPNPAIEYAIEGISYTIYTAHGIVYPFSNNYNTIDPAVDWYATYLPTNYDSARSDGAADLEAEGMGFNDDYDGGDPRPSGNWAIGAVEY
ncbi:MAG: DUF1565 domain-containing protein [Dehalococcoidia bacterium]|nr:DUF1565 domain-containing protein [Dehalococcoidia bacterium]